MENEVTMPPVPQEPPDDWEYYELWKSVQETIKRVHIYFQSSIPITGINATELYSLGEALGLIIEQEVVKTLNIRRADWDTRQQYIDYRFVRNPASFPDVLLKSIATEEVILGIELKSWYLLANEREPSFRYKITPQACAPQDLMVVVPWVLQNVLSGNPIALEPFIIPARFAAEYRNYWWQHKRKAKGDSSILSPPNIQYYPKSRSQFNDRPVEDSSGNFGRFARTGIMDNYIQSLDNYDLLGLTVSTWRKFFSEKAVTDHE